MAHDDAQEDDLPPGLAEALKAADEPLPLVTARVDRELAALAEAQFRTRRRPGVRRAAWAALAAAVLVAVLVVPRQQPAPEPPGVYADVDGSGSVDIADVLALARSKEAPSQAQLDAFARRVVSLDGGGAS